MVETKKEKLTIELDNLINVDKVLGSAIVSKDGLPIASNLSESIEEDVFAATTSAMHGAAETAIKELKKGIANEIIIEAERKFEEVSGILAGG